MAASRNRVMSGVFWYFVPGGRSLKIKQRHNRGAMTGETVASSSWLFVHHFPGLCPFRTRVVPNSELIPTGFRGRE